MNRSRMKNVLDKMDCLERLREKYEARADWFEERDEISNKEYALKRAALVGMEISGMVYVLSTLGFWPWRAETGWTVRGDDSEKEP